MGRLPATFGGLAIKERIPYELSGELNVTSAMQPLPYPSATFQNTQAKVFEGHRLIPRCIALDADGVAVDDQPDQELMLLTVRAAITDLGLTQPFTKRATLLGNLTKGTAEQTWEWADPHYLPNNAQIEISLDTLTFPAGWAGDGIVALKVCIVIEGFVLVLAPPQA